MSKRKLTLNVSPTTGCNNVSEYFSMDGFDCPCCGGSGRIRLNEGPTNPTMYCRRCGGTGYLKAQIKIRWEADIFEF